MSMAAPSRRLARPVNALLTTSSKPTISFSIRTLTSSPILSDKLNLENPELLKKHNPTLYSYLQTQKTKAPPQKSDYQFDRGTLPQSTLLGAELAQSAKEARGPSGPDPDRVITDLSKRPLEPMLPVIDPEPRRRRAWQKSMVTKEIKRRGYLSKEQQLLRTERTWTGHSEWWPTSTKKLMMLARQIQGMTLEEADVQMRFSKKRYAVAIRDMLRNAEQDATVSRGMGLGAVNDSGDADLPPIQIRTKEGKKLTVTDRTSMYIHEAWVVRGSYSLSRSFRARGRVQLLRHPKARIHVVLKEEKTRVRLYEEKEEKRQKRKLWVHLPDRPVTTQRQYALW